MNQLSDSDLAGINELFQRYGTAWAQRDIEGCVAVYAADADAVAIDGTVLRNPTEVRRYYERELSGKYEGVSTIDFHVDPPRALGTDVALMNASWRLDGLTNSAYPGLLVPVHGTFVVRKDSDGWRFAAVRLAVPFAEIGSSDQTRQPA